MTTQRIGIIGAGTMGSGIAQAFAANGFKVILQDISDTAVQKGSPQSADLWIGSSKKGRSLIKRKQPRLG